MTKEYTQNETEAKIALTGGGEMGALIRDKDWSGSTVGPIHSWPQSLKTAVSICLGTKFPMFVWWGRDLIVFYNDAYIPLAGPQKHPQFLGRPAREQWAEVWNMLRPLTEQVFETGTATWAESMRLFVVRKGFLEEVFYTFSYSPIRDDTGAVVGIINPCQETTERVLSERRLMILRKLGAEEVKNVVELGRVATQGLAGDIHDIPFALFYLTNADKKSATLIGASGVTEGTRAAPQILDLTESSPVVWPVARVNQSKKPERVDGLRTLMPDDLPQTPYDERPDSAYVVPIEVAGQSTPAGFLVLGISARLAFDDSYEGFFGLIVRQVETHLSNVRALEDEMKRSKALAEIDRAKTAFFSNVSHEFRTPLTLMLGPLEDALSSKEKSLSGEDLKSVHRNGLRLLKLVNALLDFARIEAGRIQAVYEPVDLGKLTAELASSFRSAIERAGLKLIINVDQIADPIYVDRDMYEKIVLNLMSNAFKFTFEGEIEVSLIPFEDHVELRVRDTGTGIPEQEIPRLFERFHRVHAAKARTHEGSGIGLALVQELAKLHEGEVSVKSELGKGSVFTVSVPKGAEHLPRDRIEAARTLQSTSIGVTAYVEEALRWLPSEPNTEIVPSIVSSPDPLTGTSTPVRESARIVVVDDNRDMREYLKRLLSTRFSVEDYENGALALEQVKRSPPDLVLSDVMMPVMDGFELIKRIRSDQRISCTPIILLSARAGEESTIEGMEAGADDYLMKPFSSKELFARVSTHIAMGRMRKEALQAREDAIASISHDLKNPLTAIMSASQILARRFASERRNEVPIEKMAELIQRSAHHMSRMIEDLLDASKIETGHLSLQKKPENINILLQEVAVMMAPRAAEKRIDLRKEIPVNSIFLKCDRNKILRALSNLLNNAIKFSYQGGQVTIGMEVDENDVRLFVRDNGPGISLEDCSHLFTRRWQAQGTAHLGSGLGLMITKGIVVAHGGQIEVKSVLNEGTTIWITFQKNAEGAEELSPGDDSEHVKPASNRELFDSTG